MKVVIKLKWKQSKNDQNIIDRIEEEEEEEKGKKSTESNFCEHKLVLYLHEFHWQCGINYNVHLR